MVFLTGSYLRHCTPSASVRTVSNSCRSVHRWQIPRMLSYKKMERAFWGKHLERRLCAHSRCSGSKHPGGTHCCNDWNRVLHPAGRGRRRHTGPRRGTKGLTQAPELSYTSVERKWSALCLLDCTILSHTNITIESRGSDLKSSSPCYSITSL